MFACFPVPHFITVKVEWVLCTEKQERTSPSSLLSKKILERILQENNFKKQNFTFFFSKKIL